MSGYTVFGRGTVVETPLGRGFVNYVRFAGPDYVAPAVYSVILDARFGAPGYAGSIFEASLVRRGETA